MPYTLDQLEFLKVHMGVAIPPEFTAKKSEAKGESETAPKESEEGGKKPEISLVALQQSRLAWDQARKQMQAEIQKLEASILSACKEDEEVESEEIDVSLLQTVLEKLDTRLIDKLDAALNAADPAQRAKLNQEAKGIAAEYSAFVNGNSLMADIDDSGFAAVAVRKSALDALAVLSSKL
jgi:hypothetical protein